MKLGKVLHQEPIKLYGLSATDKNCNVLIQKIFTTEKKLRDYKGWLEQYKEVNRNRNGYHAYPHYNKYFEWTNLKTYVAEAKWEDPTAQQLILDLNADDSGDDS